MFTYECTQRQYLFVLFLLLLVLPDTRAGSLSGVLVAWWNIWVHARQLWSFPLKCPLKWFKTIYTVWWAGYTADDSKWHWASVPLPRPSMNSSGGGVLVCHWPDHFWKTMPGCCSTVIPVCILFASVFVLCWSVSVSACPTCLDLIIPRQQQILR